MSNVMKKMYVTVALLLALIIAVPIGAYAMLRANTNTVNNTFSGAFIDVAVVEKGGTHEDSTDNKVKYDDLRKKNDSVEKIVTIKNTATGENAGAMYTRVRLIPSIVSDTDDTTLGGAIKLTYTFEQNTAWKMKDSIFYYSSQVEKNQETSILLKQVTLNQDIPEGYHLELKVMADSIVVRPETVLKTSWGLENGFNDMNTVPATLSI